MYQKIGQSKRAMELYEQALSICREVGDRQGEAITLHNMAYLYGVTGQPQRELDLYEQVLPLMREVGDRAGEAAVLADIAGVFYQVLHRPQEAVSSMQQAIAMLDEIGLPGAADGSTREELQQYLNAMLQGIPLGQGDQTATLPAALLQIIIHNTVVVMTTMQERRAEWYRTITGLLQKAQQQGADWQTEVEFFTAVLAQLDGQAPSLPGNHPYAAALARIQAGIAMAGIHDDAGS